MLERLIRSNHEYQRSHGHYIAPLASRLLAARAALREIRDGYDGEAIKQAREWVEQIGSPLWPNMNESDWATLMRDVLAEYDYRVGALATLRRAWDAHMETCPQHAALPDLPAPSWKDLETWRDAPSGTAAALPSERKQG